MVVASKSTASRKRHAPTRVIPLKASAPRWLRRLQKLQHRSCKITLLLMSGMLAIYGWTAYSQQSWSQSHHKLENLKRSERQLTATSEVLKNQLALQAEKPATGLEQLNPTKAIFLKPAPQRPNRTVNSTDITTASPQTAQANQLPLGY